MNFSKTTEYAFRILSYMAVNEKQICTTNEIYEALDLPYRYLRKQMTLLTKKGLIRSVRGKKGGYVLSRNKNEMSLLDIVNMMEDEVLGTECFFGYKQCNLKEKCLMHDKWEEIRRNVKSMLSHVNLGDISANGPINFLERNSL